MREMIKMIVVLSLICGLSGLVLSTLKTATRPLIEEQVLTYVQGPALKSVLPQYDNDPLKDRFVFEHPETGMDVVVFPAMKDGKLVSVALEEFGEGYGGQVGVMTGFHVEKDLLTGIGVTTMKETPGLGTKIAGHGFTTQFDNHPLTGVDLKSKGGSIDAVSGASYSSTAAVTAVNKAAVLYQALKEDIMKQWGN